MSKVVTRTFVVQAVTQAGPGVRLFRFSQGLAPLQYLPGQFTMARSGQDPQRQAALTLASAPEREYFELMVKDTGGFGSSFYSQVTRGELVSLATPAGVLTLKPEHYRRPLVFLGRDYCVAAARAHIQWLEQKDIQQDYPFILLHELSNPQENLFASDFVHLPPHRFRRINLVAGAGASSVWSGEAGQINRQLLEERVPHWKSARYLAQAEEPEARRFVKMLQEMGIPSAQMAIERWS